MADNKISPANSAQPPMPKPMRKAEHKARRKALAEAAKKDPDLQKMAEQMSPRPRML
jgi:hypothetical protein